MIKASFFYRNGVLCGFRIKGHSGYAEAGSDIVCSAVSATAQTTLIGLLEFVKPKMEYDIKKDGEMRLLVLPETDDEAFDRAALLLNTLRTGLMNIENSYHDFLTVSDKEVT